MESILYNYSNIDNVMTLLLDNIMPLLIEDIQTYFFQNPSIDYYTLNNNIHCMDFELDRIKMNINIYKTKKYYYDLSAKNFWYEKEENKENDDEFIITEVGLYISRDFDTILELLENLKEVIMNYTFFDNILCSSKQKEKLRKLKKLLSFFPKEENECSICYEPTKQITICNHPICLHCRETCIRLQKDNCPICRENGTLSIYPYYPIFTL